MTPSVIIAFDAVSSLLPDATLFIHAQVELERLPVEVVTIVRNNPRITYHVETVPAPGLYYKGRILLFPPSWKGWGYRCLKVWPAGCLPLLPMLRR